MLSKESFLIALLGDSHTRSYISEKYIAVRVFLAQGRLNNLHDFVRFFNTFVRYVAASSRLKKSGLDLGFVIGEPDIRKLAYGNWIIDSPDDRVFNSKRCLKPEQKDLNFYCFKVRAFLILTKVFGCKPVLVVGAGTPNPEMSSAVLEFNSKLEKVCKEENCLFFSPQASIVDDVGSIRSEYIGYSVFDKSQKDFTHLSVDISVDLEMYLESVYENNHLACDGWKEKINFQDKFYEVNNFDTFKVKPGCVVILFGKFRKVTHTLKTKIKSIFKIL